MDVTASLEAAVIKRDPDNNSIMGNEVHRLPLKREHFALGLTAGTYRHVIDGKSPLKDLTDGVRRLVMLHYVALSSSSGGVGRHACGERQSACMGERVRG